MPKAKFTKSLTLMIIDDFIRGSLGSDGEIKVSDVVTRYKGLYSEKYLRSILPNSEVYANHSPTYTRFTIRLGVARYSISEEVTNKRKAELEVKKGRDLCIMR